MQGTTFVNLVKRGIVKGYGTLKVNASGYPFITLLTKNSKSTNIYFSKKSSESIVDTFGEGGDITDFLRKANVVLTLNEKGEERYKLTGNSEYTSAADALGVVVEDESDFDYSRFEKEFQSQAVTA
jgi:hypothetical protein